MRFYVLFNNIAVILGRWKGNNGRLCETEPRLRMKKFPHSEIELGLPYHYQVVSSQKLVPGIINICPQSHFEFATASAVMSIFTLKAPIDCSRRQS